jgi:hypothetical protein
LKIDNEIELEHTIILSFNFNGLSLSVVTLFIANGKLFGILFSEVDTDSYVGNSRELKRLHSPRFLPSSV